MVGAEALVARAWARAPFWTREKREFCAPLRGAEGGCRRMHGLAALGRLSRRTCPRFLPSQQSVVVDQEAPHLLPRGTLSPTSGFSLVFNPLSHLNPRSPPKRTREVTHTQSKRAASSDPQHSGCKGSWPTCRRSVLEQQPRALTLGLMRGER